jgi:hypothetical protein
MDGQDLRTAGHYESSWASSDDQLDAQPHEEYSLDESTFDEADAMNEVDTGDSAVGLSSDRRHSSDESTFDEQDTMYAEDAGDDVMGGQNLLHGHHGRSVSPPAQGVSATVLVQLLDRIESLESAVAALTRQVKAIGARADSESPDLFAEDY